MNRSTEKTPMPLQNPQTRIQNFNEVALGYTAEQAKLEADRCLACKHRPCVEGCPVGVQIPEFIAALAKGNAGEAAAILKSTNTLPAVCGRVCPQETQCEARCVRGIKGEPVAIGRLERYAADAAGAKAAASVPEGKKVAVVGAGPAGLSCAGSLAQKGYRVTVFEALPLAGGVLVYGIPAFRLPKSIVEKEVGELQSLGVEIQTNMVIGKVLTLDELLADYEAVFLGTGAGLPAMLGIPGENLAGVYTANEFLTRINLMKAGQPGYHTPLLPIIRAAIVGGGNVAMDAARSALRLGAKEVTVVYRRSGEEMPARQEEIEHAREEGVRFMLLTAPLRIEGQGRAQALVCQRMELAEPDESGRRRPVPLEGSEFSLPADTVVSAIGNAPNPLLRQSAPALAANRKGCLLVEEETLATSVPGVYAGGDVVSGAATVILAMGAGRKAAESIHAYLSAE